MLVSIIQKLDNIVIPRASIIFINLTHSRLSTNHEKKRSYIFHHIQQWKVNNAMMFHIHEDTVLHIAVTFVFEQPCTRLSFFNQLIGNIPNSCIC